MKKMGIKGKMICMVIPVILVIIIAFFALSRGQIVKLAKSNLSAESQMYEEDITGWVDRILAELKVYSDAINSGLFTDDDQILRYLETSMDKNDAYPNGIYMGDDSGIYLDGSGWVPDDDWVLVERDWYKEGKEHDTLAFGAPYFESLSKQMCVSASVHMKYEKATRVMAADVYLDYVCGLMKQIEKGIGGTAFLVDVDSQKILAHSDSAFMDQTLMDKKLDPLYKNIAETLQKKRNGSMTVKGDSGRYDVCLNEIEGTGWCLVTAISERKVLKELHWLEFYMLLIAVVAGGLLTVLLIRSTNRVVRPVQAVTTVLSQVAQGDFTHDITVSGSDEIARMGDGMQIFIQNMREIMKGLMETSEWMNRQSRDNGEVSENLLCSAREQEEQMVSLKNMAAMLMQTADQVAEEMNRLAQIIHQTKGEGEQAGLAMQETAGASRQGQNALGDIQNSMQKIETTTFSLADQIAETSAAIDKINGMVSLILEIAGQTNLLSLNASIEAARAGEAGRGFAVVAEEIGKLAVNSGQAAADISALTKEIRETMEKANYHMEESVTEVKNSAGMVEAASDTFQRIFDEVGEAETIVHHMVEMIDQVDAVASQSVQMGESQQVAAQEITDCVTKLGACADSVTQNSDSAADNAKALEQQAKELAGRMEQFKL